MTRVLWGQAGSRKYETGVDRGVLYIPNNLGVYDAGYAWPGLTAVTESPSGAEPTPFYADNMKYANILSVEEFMATIEAFMSPPEFDPCDGSAGPQPGISVGQQPRQTFGFSYRTLVGNDLQGTAFGYKLHLVYGCLAAPSEKARSTVNDTPELVNFSWEVSTTPVEVTGFAPSAKLTFDSTVLDSAAMAALEDLLYGTVGTDPTLPTPDEALALFDGSITIVTATQPTYNAATDTITIPSITGVTYKIDGEVVTGDVVITEGKFITAHANAGYQLTAGLDTDWYQAFS